MDDFICECKSIADGLGCKFGVDSAKTLTTFKGGGNACVFYPGCESEFVEIYKAVALDIAEPCVLGGGSDTVIADGLCKTPVISSRGLNGVLIKDGKAYAGSGAYIGAVMKKFRENGLGGFEFLCGVPLTVGGAVRMNASAFSTETADYIDEIRVLKRDCGNTDKPYNADMIADNGRSANKTAYSIVTLKREDLNFSYRNGVRDVVLGATLSAGCKSAEESVALASRYAKARAAKQPKFPSCGSVFKNGEVPSGKLIEECGLKGTRAGGAQISELHANFIVNTSGATADDFISLVRLAEESVYNKFGVKLEREFVYLE